MQDWEWAEETERAIIGQDRVAKSARLEKEITIPVPPTGYRGSGCGEDGMTPGDMVRTVTSSVPAASEVNNGSAQSTPDTQHHPPSTTGAKPTMLRTEYNTPSSTYPEKSGKNVADYVLL